MVCLCFLENSFRARCHKTNVATVVGNKNTNTTLSCSKTKYSTNFEVMLVALSRDFYACQFKNEEALGKRLMTSFVCKAAIFDPPSLIYHLGFLILENHFF